jgi:hypothetical protein
MKKRLSLALDCRNIVAEDRDNARKVIPKRKAMRNQQERRIAAVLMSQASAQLDVDRLDAMENDVRNRMRQKRVRGFRKWPDAPLAQAIEWRRARSQRRT